MNRAFSSLLILILACIGLELIAQDVQWRGPNRDGIYPDTMLLKEWPEEGPEEFHEGNHSCKWFY